MHHPMFEDETFEDEKCVTVPTQVHGGMFRARYTADSIGTMSVLVWACGGPAMFLPVAYALLFAFLAFLKYVVF